MNHGRSVFLDVRTTSLFCFCFFCNNFQKFVKLLRFFPRRQNGWTCERDKIFKKHSTAFLADYRAEIRDSNSSPRSSLFREQRIPNLLHSWLGGNPRFSKVFSRFALLARRTPISRVTIISSGHLHTTRRCFGPSPIASVRFLGLGFRPCLRLFNAVTSADLIPRGKQYGFRRPFRCRENGSKPLKDRKPMASLTRPYKPI